MKGEQCFPCGWGALVLSLAVAAVMGVPLALAAVILRSGGKPTADEIAREHPSRRFTWQQYQAWAAEQGRRR